MKVDTKPFPQANVVELSDFGSKGQDLAFQINMVGPMRPMISRGERPLLANGRKMNMSWNSGM